MLTPRERIERQMKSSSLTALFRVLTRLKSPLTLINTGAHPDDEFSGMLAWFSLGLGMRVIIGCSTRGEGGQNVLGPERIGALGVLRTREMEAAARILDADVCWLGHGPDDPVHDFGFSKDGDGTFARWGEARIVERLVRALRAERPDIVIPTFLDVPGQHGHHRAMTRAAETAVQLAADSNAFPEHFSAGLSPWTVAKFYLPAWSGGGAAYDDELPPPPATLTVTAKGVDPVTGAAYDRIGEQSRYYHASQGMGHWPERPVRSWPLHLLLSAEGTHSETSILDGLPTSLAALCDASPDCLPLRPALIAADEAIAAALAGFPDRATIRAQLLIAAEKIESTQAAASGVFLKLHGHRLSRKLNEIEAALLEVVQVFERAYAQTDNIASGGTTELSVVLHEQSDAAVVVTPLVPNDVTVTQIRAANGIRRFALKAGEETRVSAQYAPGWSSLGGNGPVSLQLSTIIDDRTVTGRFDPETPLTIAPACSLRIKPDAIILPLGARSAPSDFEVVCSEARARISFETPPGWKIAQSESRWTVTPPQSLSSGLTVLTPMVNEAPAFRIIPFDYPHIGRNCFIRRERLRVLALDLKLPETAKIGYIGGGADNVGIWLERMGLDVTALNSKALAGDLSGYTAIVVGIFAFGTRADAAAATSKLHRFVADGGHLITLYHRPCDGWSPEKTPPRFLKIGAPSLRWRVTDPEAEVRVLVTDHKLLRGPNLIGPDDWTGWDKERGLYFAAAWDEAYEPLLAMHDPGEQPLEGALISARIGKGRHTHTSLVLHHQMDKLVPGAFRLMANLVQPA